MNNTPENNNYTDYNLNGTQNQGQFRSSRTPSQNTNRNQAARPVQNAQRRPAQNPVNPSQQRPSQQRRPLNDEDRRRLEAARMAAMQSGGMSDEEMRRRRMEQQRLNSAQPQTVTRQPVQQKRQTPQGYQNYQSYQNQQSRQQNQAQPNRRKKKRIRINAGAVIFLVIIAGVIGVSVNQINKNEENAAKEREQNIAETLPDDAYLGAETDALDETLPVQDETAAETTESEENLTLYDKIMVVNTTVDEGDLVLVNYDHAYADADSVSLKNVYNERTSVIKVANTNIGLTGETLSALDAMLNDLTADTGCDDLLIVSGHRTVAEQQEIYDGYLASSGQEYVDQYVADPQYSEHHTGLACDLSFFTDDGYSVPISDHEFGYWLGENCAEHGFVRRYPEDKVDITKISYEAWHFRYVGVPHAYAMTALDYCLEEYIDYIKGYTADTKLLHILPDRAAADIDVTGEIPTSGGWLAYFVPMAEGENTEIKLLRGEMYSNYEISGNNVDGYIVTVTLPEVQDPAQ